MMTTLAAVGMGIALTAAALAVLALLAMLVGYTALVIGMWRA